MDIDRNNQIIRVAKMYYMDNIPQNRIAEKEGISKPTVSRLIKKAHELGYVKISIIQPNALTLDMETRITKFYGLKTVKIFSPTEDEPDSAKKLYKGLIWDLKNLIVDNTRIAISWNNNFNRLDDLLADTHPEVKSHCKVVQLNGCLAPTLEDYNPSQFTLAFADLFDAKAIQVCSLPLLEQKKTVKMLRNDDPIKTVLDYASKADVAILSPELITQSGNVLIRGGLKMNEIEDLRKEGGMGIIAGHVLTNRGKLADPSFDQRLVAVSLNDIKKIPNKFVFVANPVHAKFAEVLCESKLVNRLYITEAVAQKFNC